MTSRSRLARALRSIVRDLSEVGADFALVGGLAVSARTEPRFTRDADVAVSVDGDRAAEALLRVLLERGYRVDALIEQDRVGRLATARLLPPGEDPRGVVVDLLFASSGIEPETVSQAEVLEIVPGIELKVATRPHLIATKVLSRDDETRPQDKADLLALREASTAAEIEEARELLIRIRERGFSRGKDLVADLDALVRGRAKP